MDITHKFLKGLIDAVNGDGPPLIPLNSLGWDYRNVELEESEIPGQLKAFMRVLTNIGNSIPNRQTLDQELVFSGVQLSRQSEYWSDLALYYLDLLFLEGISSSRLPDQKEIGERLFLKKSGLLHLSESQQKVAAKRALGFIKASSHPTGFEGLEEKEESPFIASTKLTPKEHDCARLHYDYNLTVSDIARRMRIARSGVQRHLNKATIKMKNTHHNAATKRGVKTAEKGQNFIEDEID